MAKSYRKFIAGAATAAVVASSFAGVAGAASFSDVDSSTTHQEGILALVDAGIIKGYEDGTFRPYAQITRGEAAIMVARALDLLDGKNIPANPFADVSENSVAYEAIVKLADKGIVSGFTNDTFKPYEKVTRAQVAKYVAKAYGYEEADGITKFPDVNKNAALAGFVDVLADAGIIQGKANGNFGYNDALRRADFSGIVYRAEQAKKDKKPGDDQNEKGILTVTSADDAGYKLTNGSSKTYKVKLVSPVSGKPVAGAELNVTFEENLDTDFGPQRKVTVTNSDNESVIPYQSKDGNEAEAVITTDKNGIATFTVTGTNATVTPIVFLDGSFQEWNLEGDQLPPTQDGRFDKGTELYAKAEAVTFGVTEYAITVEGKGGNYAAVAEKKNGETYDNGREYTISVKKPDGTPFAGGTVNVGIYELLDGKLGNEPTGAYIVGNPGTVKLDSKGQAKITLASTDDNDSAEPMVWIDQNWDVNNQGEVYEEGEPVSDHTKVAPTNFQAAYVDGAKLRVIDLTDEARAKFGDSNKYWKNVEDVKGINFEFLNQSGVPYLPESSGRDWSSDARVTFEIVNTGAHPVRIHTNNLIDEAELRNAVGAQFLDGTDESARIVEIQVGGRATIAGNIKDADFYELNDALIAAYSLNGLSSVSVKATAVVDKLAGEESQSVSVSAGPVTVNFANTALAPTLLGFTEDTNNDFIDGADEDAVVLKDTNGDGEDDALVLTFTDEVFEFEKGDFRLYLNDDTNIPASSVSYGTKDSNVNDEDKKKLVVKFSEQDIAKAKTISYDKNNANGSALQDEFGNEVRSFNVKAE